MFDCSLYFQGNQPASTCPLFLNFATARGGRKPWGVGKKGREEKGRGEESLHNLIFSSPPSLERGFASSSHRKAGKCIFLLSIQQMKTDLSEPAQLRNKVDSVSQRASQTEQECSLPKVILTFGVNRYQNKSHLEY